MPTTARSPPKTRFRRYRCTTIKTGCGDITDSLAAEIEIDLTRRQFAGDEVLWRIRFTGHHNCDRRRGQAGARFQNGTIIRFALGPSSGDGTIDRRIVL
jgi:NTE family protein